MKKILKDLAQASFKTKIECLEWFIEDDTRQLYDMIENNIGLDEWFDGMNNRIYEHEGVYYILEEDDFLTLQTMEERQ
jgi:hypothetical protein